MRLIWVLAFEDAGAAPFSAMLALGCLEDTHEQVNGLLEGKGAPVEAFTLVSDYIEALRKVKEAVLWEIKWTGVLCLLGKACQVSFVDGASHCHRSRTAN